MPVFDAFGRRTGAVLACTVLLTCLLSAQEGEPPPYVLNEDVVSCGGGRASSTNYQVQDVLGEPFAPGLSSTVEFRERTGFIEALTASLENPLDINVDGAVGPEDTFTFAMGWLRARGQPGYRPRADINGNFIINRYDLDLYIAMLRQDQ
jgi:hypothetical protein